MPPPTTTTPESDRIYHLRSSLDLSQEGFARLFGVSTSLVSRWETGRNTPAASGAAMLDLLERALKTHKGPEIVDALRPLGGDGSAVMQELARLAGSAPVRNPVKARRP